MGAGERGTEEEGEGGRRVGKGEGEMKNMSVQYHCNFARCQVLMPEPQQTLQRKSADVSIDQTLQDS